MNNNSRAHYFFDGLYYCFFNSNLNVNKVIAIYLTFIFFLLTGCRDEASYREMDGDVWTTSFHIKYQCSKSLDDSISNILAQVDRSLSMFNDSSLVSRVNRNDTSVIADRMLREVFEASKILNSESLGAFDPTVGPLTDLWGFGRSKAKDYIPTESEIKKALESVGINDCSILPDGRITKKSPDTLFDFSAIAKGYACDQIADMFHRNGVCNYLIEIGGEITAGGTNLNGKPWQILIDNPFDEAGIAGNSGVKIIELSDRAIATSGDYRRAREQNGRKFSHILDPVTGYPRQSEVVSATVIAPDCMTADGLATACMALPADSAVSMLRRHPDIEGFLILQKSPADSIQLIHVPVNTLRPRPTKNVKSRVADVPRIWPCSVKEFSGLND